jgi:two-component system, cell cycle response regulator
MKIGAQGRALVAGALTICGVWLVFNEVRIVAFGNPSWGFVSSRWAHDIVLLTSSGLCLARAATQRRQRMAWLLIGLGMLAWSAGELYYTSVLWNATKIPIPSPDDFCCLFFAPLTLAGLVVLQRRRSRGGLGLLWADGVTTALSMGALSAALLFQQVLTSDSGSPLAFATTLSYPLCDMLLLAAVFGALARRGWHGDRVWTLLAIGLLMNWVADTLYLVATAAGTYVEGSWFDTGWWAGFFLIAVAAWQPQEDGTEALSEPGIRQIAIPLASGSLGLVLLVCGAVHGITWLGVVLSAASVVGVMVRLLLTYRENVEMLRHSRTEALADPLTGLGNRRALTRRLEAFFAAGGPEARLLVLFDLDGFKAYNDRFGHPAGDALLRRLTGRLSDAVGDCGEAFRMGGDEFCALVPAAEGDDEALLMRLAAALSESGDGFAVTCSYGAIVLPAEADSLSEALRSVDRRMYAHKQAGRMSAERQARDVLLGAMREGAHGLDAHGRAVAALAERVARTMGLSDGQVEEIHQAGELHDVGKLAVPDAVLTDPGLLPPGDRALIHQRSCVGERILATAPALAHLARLVRHSHERWDGTGYPDGLAGEDIPLGARIIAVADAYETLTTAPPYRAAVTPAAAVSELRRFAGRQFDPVVVAALARLQTGNEPEPPLALAAAGREDAPAT